MPETPLPAVRSLLRSTKEIDWGFLREGNATGSVLVPGLAGNHYLTTEPLLPAVRSLLRSTKALDWVFLGRGNGTCSVLVPELAGND